MKLKVKPHFNNLKRNDRNKQSVLSNSFSSNSSIENRENKSKGKLNRLDKIMNIKVVKPKVNSTLTYYQPKQGSRTKPAERKESAVR